MSETNPYDRIVILARIVGVSTFIAGYGYPDSRGVPD